LAKNERKGRIALGQVQLLKNSKRYGGEKKEISIKKKKEGEGPQQEGRGGKTTAKTKGRGKQCRGRGKRVYKRRAGQAQKRKINIGGRFNWKDGGKKEI